MPKRKSHLRGLTLAVAVLGVGALGFYLLRPERVPDYRLLTDAEIAFRAGRFDEAEQLALSIDEDSGHRPAALLLAGKAAMRASRQRQAIGHLAGIPGSLGDVSAAAALLTGDSLYALGRATEAEASYRRALAIQPEFAEAHRRLAHLLGAVGRRAESVPHLFELLKQRRIEITELILLGDPWPDLSEPEEIDRLLAAVPADPRPLLGTARGAARNNRLVEAESLLRRVVAADPHPIEAQAWLGWTLLLAGDAEPFLRWHAQLPAAADGHPQIWLVRGMWARGRGESREAIRCFWETVRRDPNHDVANYHLSVLLNAEGDAASAAKFQERAQRLYDLFARLRMIYFDRQDLSQIPNARQELRTVGQLCEALGRLPEAHAWYKIAQSVGKDEDERIRDDLARLENQLSANPVQTSTAANPARVIDLSKYPLPNWTPSPRPEPAEDAADRQAAISFVDSAAATGIDLLAYNGGDAATPGSRLLESYGCGVAALDYDADSWPDLYFTQACPWPIGDGQPRYPDRLYRNLGGGRFEDVAAATGLGDERFSQGVSVGDFDNDGFADLYVANLGANRLYRNNGDGTFSDVGAAAGLAATGWTTSCLVADLNGDTLPDLYDVNYVPGDSGIEQQCIVRGHPGTCQPAMFPAEDDRFYLNLGDGRFEERAAAAGLTGPNGRGMGIVAADFDGSGRLSLFVTNDGTANFYFVNETTERGADPAFVDRGLICGLALDGDGRSLASMGIAAGDADGNGLLDLYVTTFLDEPKPLFLQQTAGSLFVDATAQAGLRDVSLPVLGFGTQFVDGDLDGRLDLIVANGHVEDYGFLGKPYAMPPKFYRNLGDARFVELPPDGLGPYFAGNYLGRGMARLDWNRDGREDLAVSHMDQPVALLTNTTADAGHFLAVQLRGVASDRDAIGTTVSVTAGDKTWVGQLTAGDGFQASNQRQLVFGLGRHEKIDQMTIRWPAGGQQTFLDLAADSELLFIEGRDEPAALPTARRQ